MPECEICHGYTTGEVRYCPLQGGNHVVCNICCWRFGNFCDYVRVLHRLPTYKECRKRLGRLHAVLPNDRKHYDQLCRFWEKTHAAERNQHSRTMGGKQSP